MIEEINNILKSETNNDYISLYKIYKVLENIVLKQEKLRDLSVDKMNRKLKNIYNPNYYLDKEVKIIMCFFDYDHDELGIILKNTLNLYEKYYLKKLDIFKITESKDDFNRKKLDVIMNDLEELYDSYDEVKKTYKAYYNEINVLNSNFLLNINLNTIDLYLKKNSLYNLIDIKLFTYSREHFIDAPSNVQEYIENNFYEILNKAQIKKIDCPSWIKEKI